MIAELSAVVLWHERCAASFALSGRQHAVLSPDFGVIPCVVSVIDYFTVFTLVFQKISRFLSGRPYIFFSNPAGIYQNTFSACMSAAEGQYCIWRIFYRVTSVIVTCIFLYKNVFWHHFNSARKQKFIDEYILI